MPGSWLEDLLRPGAPPLPAEAPSAGPQPPAAGDAPSAGRFEGLYGPLYDRAIQSDALRRLAPLAYGDAGPIPDLDAFVRLVADGTVSGEPRGGDAPVLLDVPCGGGTLLPRLERQGYAGRVVEADLSEQMLDRSARVRTRVGLDVALLRADAQDLPLHDASVDAAVSLNGLHCMPDPAAFVGELARVVRPGGRLWLVTLVSGGTRRGDVVIAAGRLTGILPGAPPRRPELLEQLHATGFGTVTPLGGEALTGLACVRD